MPNGPTEVDAPARAWWGWFAASIFLLIPVDLLTTLVAVAEYGTAVEANPLMRWLLTQGLAEVVVANLVAVALAVFLFDTAIGAVRHAPLAYRETLVRGVSVWLGFVFVAGLALTGNNLLIIL